MAPVRPPDARKSALLQDAGFHHAFFTRLGGVSEGPYATLNTSTGAGDDAVRVRQNVERIERALEVPPGALYYASQVDQSGEALEPDDYRQIAEIWAAYRRD